MIVLIGLITRSSLILGAGFLLIISDAARMLKQGRLFEFLPLRIIGGWQMVMGLLLPSRSKVDYVVREVT